MEKFKSYDRGSFRFRKGPGPHLNHGRARILSEIRMPDNTSGIYAARFTPDGKIIAVTCGSGGIQLRDGETGELRETLRGGLEQALPVMCARFGPRPHKDSRKDKGKAKGPAAASSQRASASYTDSDSDSDMESSIVSSSASPAVRDLSSKEPTSKEEDVSEKILKFRLKSSGVFYAGSACGRIFKCILKEGLCESFSKEEGNEVHAVDLDLTSTVLVTGGKDATVRLYDTQTSKIMHEYERPIEGEYEGHTSRIYCVRFDPGEKNTIFSGGWDDIVKMWDIRTPKGVVHNFYGPHICGSDSIDIQGDYLLTGSWTVRDSIKVWDIREKEVLNHVRPDNRQPSLDGEFMYAVQFFNGDPTLDLILAGGSGTGALEIISRNENKVVEQFHTDRATLTIDSFGPVITFGGMSNKFTIGEYT